MNTKFENYYLFLAVRGQDAVKDSGNFTTRCVFFTWICIVYIEQ